MEFLTEEKPPCRLQETAANYDTAQRPGQTETNQSSKPALYKFVHGAGLSSIPAYPATNSQESNTMKIGAALRGETLPWSFLLYALGVVVSLWWAWRVLDWAWLGPRRIGRALRAQGVHGTTYRFPSGDLKEEGRLAMEALSKPMPLSHNITSRVLPLFCKVMKEHGKICITWFGSTPRVLINDPKLVREILSNKFGHFMKQKSNRIINLLFTGLVRHEGEKWAIHRRIINTAFHLEKLKRMLPAFETCCCELISRWESCMGSDGTHELDVWPELQSLTGDVISRSAFGSSFNEGRRIFQLQSEQATNAVQVGYRMYIPGYSFLPTKLNRTMEANEREVRALLSGIIARRERAIRDGHVNNDDLLGMLMESNIRESKQSGNSKPMMSMEDIIEECKLFYLAGAETTAILLTWTMVVLSMHLDWQERAREEVLRVFRNNEPNFDSLSQLKVVTMILYEVLRLYPPVTVMSRRTYKEIELGGITYPPGVMLMLPVMCIHHDPDVWGEDADEFRPERFAEGIAKASKDPPAFFPFSWGPRICVGQNFALLEAKMGLSMIMQHFSFELSPSYTHAPFPVSMLLPQHGAQIKLTKL